jgi:hypothetical protein
MRQPASLSRVVLAHAALTVLGLVTVVLTWVLRDDLVRSWAEGRSASLREVLRTGGVDALAASGVDPPAFVPVAVVLFVVLVMLVWVLVAFVRLGFGWARLVLTGLLAFTAIATVAGIRTTPPTVFVLLAAVSLVVSVAAVAFLWHPDTTAYLRAATGSGEAPDQRPDADRVDVDR